MNFASPALNAPNPQVAAASPPTIYEHQTIACTQMRSSQYNPSTQFRLSLPPKSPLHLLRPPIHLHLALIHILIDPLHPLANSNILHLALLQHLEDQIAADARVVSVAKVLVHALLERLDALAHLLGVVRVDELLEHGARVRGALRDGLGRAAAGREEGFRGLDEFLRCVSVGKVDIVAGCLLRACRAAGG